MKILLLNDNPVVNKLVTLSAQKTSDELEVVENTDVINAGSYDLVVVDDTLYRDTLFGVLREKITFVKSLYICSRDAEDADEFSRIIKKPFLPTDLVELFSIFGKEVKEEMENTSNEREDFDKIEDISDNDTFTLEEINLDDDEEISLDIEDEISLDDDLFSNLDLSEDSLDLDDLSSDILDLDDLEEEVSEGVLDKDELQEVQELLDMTDSGNSEEVSGFEDLSLENEIKLDEVLELDDIDSILDEIDESTTLIEKDEIKLDEESELDDLEDSIDENIEEESSELKESLLEDELEVDSLLDEIEETTVESEEVSELSDDLVNEEEVEMDRENEELLSEVNAPKEEISEEVISNTDNLELEIEQAISELTQEELESEFDETTLVNIVDSEFDSLDSLNSRDLKIAFGEAVPVLDERETLVKSEEPLELNEESINNVPKVSDLEITPDNEGVESLKKLLLALSDKNIVATMKGMKISINIELGDN